MSETLTEKLEAILEDENEEALGELLGSTTDQEERFKILETALQMEAYELVLENTKDQTADTEKPGADARPWTMRGLALFYQDYLEDAQLALTVALKVNPRSVEALMGRSMVLRELNFERAAMLDIDKAQMLVSEISPDDDDERCALKAEVHNLRASFALEDEQPEVAVEELRAAAAACPQDATYALDLGRLLTLQGDMEGAIAALDQAIDNDELLIEALLLKSHTLGLLTRHEEAIAAARQAVEIDDEEPFSLVQLAGALLLANRPKDVLETLDKAAEIDAEMPDIYHLKMAALQAVGRAGELGPEAQQYLSEAPDLPNFLYGERFDPYSDAADTLAELSSMDPQELMGMANELFDSGQLPEALRPLMEQVMRDLPAMLEQMPEMLGMLPPEMAGQLQALTGGGAGASKDDDDDAGRSRFQVIDGGKNNK